MSIIARTIRAQTYF